ncbi:arsenate reductase family protein [Caldithrix abyssi]|nr:arsenate reductase family protein [Caldithrix abyssi]
MMITLYGVPTCQKIRKTRALLEQLDIDYQFVNVKKTPIPEDELRTIVAQLGLDKVINSKGPTYRKLGLKNKNLSDEELFQILLKEQGMITRPLIKKGDRYWIGMDEEGIKQFLS